MVQHRGDRGVRQHRVAPVRIAVGVVAAAVLFAGALTGCGGGGDDITREDSSATAATGGQDSNLGSAEEAIDRVKIGGGFTPGVEDCASLSGAVSALLTLPTLGILGFDDVGDEIAEAVENLNARVPDELAGPFEVLRSVFEQYADLGPIDIEALANDPSANQRLVELSELYETPEVEEAIGAFDDFFAKNCAGAVPDP